MPPDATPYRTIAERSVVEFDVRGSTFIGYAAPVSSVEDAKAFVAEVRARHPDANHNVPAYRVRGKPPVEWASDDGEPAGSSGKPALNVLQQQDLLDVAVVVTRYFGGTLLGVGGLVRAYSRGAREAVESAGIVARVPRVTVTIRVDYEDVGAVHGILESAGVDVDAAYGADVTFSAEVPVPDADALRDRVRSATRGRADVR